MNDQNLSVFEYLDPARPLREFGTRIRKEFSDSILSVMIGEDNSGVLQISLFLAKEDIPEHRTI